MGSKVCLQPHHNLILHVVPALSFPPAPKAQLGLVKYSHSQLTNGHKPSLLTYYHTWLVVFHKFVSTHTSCHLSQQHVFLRWLLDICCKRSYFSTVYSTVCTSAMYIISNGFR